MSPSLEKRLPIHAEICEANAAECRWKAAIAAGPLIKEKFRELAQEWQKLSLRLKTTAQAP
jgi:hypothetical protein